MMIKLLAEFPSTFTAPIHPYSFILLIFFSLTRLCICSCTFCSNLVISSTLAVAVLSSVLACLHQDTEKTVHVYLFNTNLLPESQRFTLCCRSKL